MIGVPFHITGHKKVKAAVIVVIEETRGAGPSSASDASLGGHVSEGAIAIVVIEDVFPVAGDKKIRIPVAAAVVPRRRKSRRLKLRCMRLHGIRKFGTNCPWAHLRLV